MLRASPELVARLGCPSHVRLVYLHSIGWNCRGLCRREFLPWFSFKDKI